MGGNVIKVGKFVKCNICKKRQATILCDMPVGTTKTLHKTKTEKLSDGTLYKAIDLENSFKERTLTCDRVVCEKCSKKVGHDRHICKKCIGELK